MEKQGFNKDMGLLVRTPTTAGNYCTSHISENKNNPNIIQFFSSLINFPIPYKIPYCTFAFRNSSSISFSRFCI